SVEPTTVHDLASHMGVTASTMSLHLDKLERGGYVRRVRSRTDARRVELRLSPAGVRIKQQQKVLDPRLVDLMLARLNDSERRTALDGLALLAKAAKELIASDGFRDAIRTGAI
ncbi:MAG TPA: MarR family transcriptional regulator, partial [Bryobacteraceae bacterium]